MRIKELREFYKLQQKELASILEISPNTLSQYENEKRQLPIDVLIKLARYYKVSTDYILGLED